MKGAAARFSLNSTHTHTYKRTNANRSRVPPPPPAALPSAPSLLSPPNPTQPPNPPKHTTWSTRHATHVCGLQLQQLPHLALHDVAGGQRVPVLALLAVGALQAGRQAGRGAGHGLLAISCSGAGPCSSAGPAALAAIQGMHSGWASSRCQRGRLENPQSPTCQNQPYIRCKARKRQDRQEGCLRGGQAAGMREWAGCLLFKHTQEQEGCNTQLQRMQHPASGPPSPQHRGRTCR